MADYYRIFNLEPFADEAEVKKAFNREMRVWSNRTNAPQMERRQEAERMVKLLEEAEGVLLDSTKRAEYDRSQPGSQGRSTGGSHAAADRSGQREGDRPAPDRDGDAASLIQEGWRLLIDDCIGEALEVAARATELEPTNADAWALLGQAKFRSGDIDDAIYEYKRAIKLRSSEASYYGDLGSIYESIERWHEAVQQYERAAQIDPKTTMYRAAIGIVYVKTGNLEEAIGILERCVREEPGNQSYQQALGYAYVDGMLLSWWKQGDQYCCLSEEQALQAMAVLQKARALRFDDAELRGQLDERGKLIVSMFARQFKGSWAMVILLGLFYVVPGVLWWWVNRRPVYKINRDIHDVVEHNKADAVVGGELGAYFSALPPGFKWMAYRCPRWMVWIAILMLSPFTFLYLVYDNYGPKYLLGAMGGVALLLLLAAITGGISNSDGKHSAARPVTETSGFVSQATPSSQNRGTSLPEGYTIPPSTISPDGRYGVLVPDSAHQDKNNDSNQNRLVEIGTGRVLATINAVTWWEDRPGQTTRNHASLDPHWSADSSMLSWVIGGKWFPAACVLLKMRNANIEWQFDVFKSSQKDILARTKVAVPRNYEAAKRRNEGNSIHYPDGFTVSIETPTGQISLPLRLQVTLTSNPKQIEDFPRDAWIRATMLATITSDGQIGFSAYNVSLGNPVAGIEENIAPVSQMSVKDKATPTGTEATIEPVKGETADGVREYIRQRLLMEGSHDLDKIAANYAERVEYWGNGSVDRDFIRKDKAAYYTRWPQTVEEVISPIEVARRQDAWVATFRTRFRVENQLTRVSIEGVQESTYCMRLENGNFRILEENGKVIEKIRKEGGVESGVARRESDMQAGGFEGESYPQTRMRFLTAGDIQDWNDDKLRYAINEMYARHGADFNDANITRSFQRFSWYRPAPGATYDDVERNFTEIEKQNLNLLGTYRNSKKKFPLSTKATSTKPIPQRFPVRNNPPKISPSSSGSLHEKTRGLDGL